MLVLVGLEVTVPGMSNYPDVGTGPDAGRGFVIDRGPDTDTSGREPDTEALAEDM